MANILISFFNGIIESPVIWIKNDKKTKVSIFHNIMFGINGGCIKTEQTKNKSFKCVLDLVDQTTNLIAQFRLAFMDRKKKTDAYENISIPYQI